MKINPDMMPVMVAALDYDDLDSVEVSKKVEEELIPELESVEGVASVDESGAIEEKIQVIIQQDKIDKMNDLVQDAIDGKLSDAEDKIEKGEEELEEGKEKLEEGEEEAADKIAKGETKINRSTEEIKEGLETIEENITEVKEQRKTLKKTEKQVNSGLATVKASKASLQSTITTLTQTKTELESLSTTLESLKSQESSLQSQIDALGDQATDELKTSLSSVQAQRKVIDDQLSQMGLTEDSLETQITEVSENLTTAQSSMSELETQEKSLKKNKKKVNKAKKKIEKGLKKLRATKKKLKSGKITAEEALEELNKQKILTGIQLSVSEAKLDSGSSELEDAKEEFKDTKKTTKENADLNNIITKEMVENILTAENFDMPSGYVTEDDASYLVRVGDKVESVEEIEDLVICDMDLDGLDPITLGDVADVAITDDSDDIYTVVNGNPAVMFTMQKQSGYSTGDVSDALMDRFDELEAANEGLHISVLMDQGVYIDLVVDAVVQNLLIGAVLAILILLFFLRDLRPTLIVACSIPLSVIAAIVAMYFSGVTQNIISLSGLALGVGMLVDNSVVVIENIFRLKKEGYSTRKAAVEGAKQVSGAIVASTLTTICVFAPIIFTEGLTRELFVDLALTLAYTLAASLIVALTLVPAMSAGLIKRTPTRESRLVNAMQRGYAKVIDKVLRYKAIVLVGALVLLVVFAALAMNNGFSMMPDMESTQMTVTLEMDDGADLDETREISNQAIDAMREIEDIDTVGAYTGSGSSLSMLTGSSSDNTVTMYVILNEDRKLSNDELTAQIQEKTKNLDCEVDVDASAIDMSSLMGEGVSINVKGKDLDKLQSISEDLMAELESVDGLEEITNGLEDSGEEYRVTVDKAKAMKYSLTVAGVYQQIYEKLADASSASTISTDTEDLGVYVSSSTDEEMTRDDVKNLEIEYTDSATQKTKTVKLMKIATFETADSPNTINRESQTRYVSVTADIKDGYITSDVSSEVEKIVGDYDTPDGYILELDGENETTMESMRQVMLMLTLGILLMYLIMVAQFQSLLSPFIILFTIPLAFTGGFLGLWISGSDVSVIAMIGFVMLSGIIVNNGIVLVDYINQLRRGGMEKREAIKEAGVTRLRPILMTAVTTILGLLPMVIGGSMGTDMTRPMAIVTVGGLIYGTFLTLFVVPCIYDVLNRKKDMREREID